MNLPLVDDTAVAVSEEVAKVIEELLELFDSTTARHREIGTTVNRAKLLARQHRHAELYLVITVGMEVANPAYPCIDEYIRSYRRSARQCPDYRAELEERYAEVLLDALRQWSSHRSTMTDTALRQKYDKAITNAKEYLDELRTPLVIPRPR